VTSAVARTVGTFDRTDARPRPTLSGLVVQLGPGVAIAVLYVAFRSLGVTTASSLVAVLMMPVAVLLPASGLASLAIVIPVAETDAFSPLGINAALVAATGFGALLRLPFSRPTIHVSYGAVLVVAYVVYSAASLVAVLGGYPATWLFSAGVEFVHMATGVAIFLIATHLFRTTPSLVIVGLALMMVGLSSALAIGEFYRIGSLIAPFRGLLVQSGEVRANGMFSNSNYLGFFSTQGLLLSFGVLMVAPRRFRPIVVAIIGLTIASLALSFSRGALIGASTGIVAFVATRNRRAAVVVLVVMAIAVVSLYPLFLETRLDTQGGANIAAYIAGKRSEMWREAAFGAGIHLFASNPAFGVGFGLFHFLSPPFIGSSPATYPHDQWLQILAEQGIVGATFVGCFAVLLAIGLWRSRHPLAPAAFAMFVAYVFESAFISSITSIQISGMTWIVLAAVLSRAAPGRRGPGS
jgi:O-antigen ligase